VADPGHLAGSGHGLQPAAAGLPGYLAHPARGAGAGGGISSVPDDEEEAIEAGVTAASEEIIPVAGPPTLFASRWRRLALLILSGKTVVKWDRWYQISGVRSDTGLP